MRSTSQLCWNATLNSFWSNSVTCRLHQLCCLHMLLTLWAVVSSSGRNRTTASPVSQLGQVSSGARRGWQCWVLQSWQCWQEPAKLATVNEIDYWQGNAHFVGTVVNEVDNNLVNKVDDWWRDVSKNLLLRSEQSQQKAFCQHQVTRIFFLYYTSKWKEMWV